MHHRTTCSLIFVSLENWDDIWRRNQFVCAELARRYPDMQILFVCPPRDVSNAIRTRRLASLRGPNNWHPEGFRNITVTKPLKLLPSTLAVGRWVNDLMARVHVRGMLRLLNDHGSIAGYRLQVTGDGRGYREQVTGDRFSGPAGLAAVPTGGLATEITEGDEVTGYRLQGTGADDEVTGDRLQGTGGAGDEVAGDGLAGQPAGRGPAGAERNIESSDNTDNAEFTDITANTECTEPAARNPYFLQVANQHRTNLYAA